jgi:isoleucyl-tRNA synthetase
LDAAAPDSVHHNDYPTADDAVIDTVLEEDMGVVRNIVNLGRGRRKSHDLKVRQPLSRLTVVTRDGAVARSVESHRALIKEELNVREIVLERDEGHLVALSAKANFKVLGPRLGKRTAAVADAIAALDHDQVDDLLEGASIDAAGEAVTAADVVVQREPLPGVVVAADPSFSVALDTTVDAELEREGLAREIINRIQSLRRRTGLEVSDRITLRWSTDDEPIAEAMQSHRALIASEVLAVETERAGSAVGERTEVNGAVLYVDVERT